MPETETVETTVHRPEPWFWEAGSDKCPHGAEPADDSPEWDAWDDRHSASPQGVVICLDAPMGDVCVECSEDHNEAVPWSACDERAHARPQPGTVPAPDGSHQPVTVWVSTLECFERECDEYATDDGDDNPAVERCSHISFELVCGGCSVAGSDGEYETTESWPCPVAEPTP